MWNSCASFNRVKKAMEYRGLNPKRLDLDDLARVFRKRGITDRQQNEIVHRVLVVLEPTPCWVSHCKHYGGVSAFCNCGEGLIPGKCKIRRDFLKRRRGKVAKATDDLLSMMNAHFKENTLTWFNFKGEDYVSFFDDLEKASKKFRCVRKWRSLHADIWAEIQKRAKAARKTEVREAQL